MEDAYITGLLPERFNQMLLVESGLDSDKVKDEEIWITDDLRFFSHKEVPGVWAVQLPYTHLVSYAFFTGFSIEGSLPRQKNDLCPWV